MLIKYTCGSKSQTLRMRYPFHSTGRPISHRNGWSFRVYMIPLRDFVPEWNSRPGTTTGVNSRRGDSRRHNILWWYHVNKYRVMKGNRNELAPGRLESRPGVMQTPPKFTWFMVHQTNRYIPSGQGRPHYVAVLCILWGARNEVNRHEDTSNIKARKRDKVDSPCSDFIKIWIRM